MRNSWQCTFYNFDKTFFCTKLWELVLSLAWQIPTWTTLVRIQSEYKRWIHGLWSSSASHWGGPSLSGMSIEIETAFLHEVWTAKRQCWSMGPQSWACSWANQTQIMCLLRDPTVHRSLLHHSRRRNGLSAWRTSDTWRPQTRPEILSKGWCGWIHKREHTLHDFLSLSWNEWWLCVCTAVSLSVLTCLMWGTCVFICLHACCCSWLMNMAMTDEGENDEICDNDCSLSHGCHQHQPCHMFPNAFSKSKGYAVDSLFFRVCGCLLCVEVVGRWAGHGWF